MWKLSSTHTIKLSCPDVAQKCLWRLSACLYDACIPGSWLLDSWVYMGLERPAWVGSRFKQPGSRSSEANYCPYKRNILIQPDEVNWNVNVVWPGKTPQERKQILKSFKIILNFYRLLFSNMDTSQSAGHHSIPRSDKSGMKYVSSNLDISVYRKHALSTRARSGFIIYIKKKQIIKSLCCASHFQ